MVSDGRVVCLHDDRHGIALGGTGSGWHAEQGHVPGSQGGTHAEARDAHKAAADAHTRAVKHFQKTGEHDPALVAEASRLSKEAMRASSRLPDRHDDHAYNAKDSANLAAGNAETADREGKSSNASDRAGAARAHAYAADLHKEAARSHNSGAKKDEKAKGIDPQHAKLTAALGKHLDAQHDAASDLTYTESGIHPDDRAEGLDASKRYNDPAAKAAFVAKVVSKYPQQVKDYTAAMKRQRQEERQTKSRQKSKRYGAYD